MAIWAIWLVKKIIEICKNEQRKHPINYQNAIKNKPVLNVLSKENMDSLLGDEGAFKGWPLKSWGLLSRGSDPLVLILRDIFKIVISQQKYTQTNMSIYTVYILSLNAMP